MFWPLHSQGQDPGNNRCKFHAPEKKAEGFPPAGTFGHESSSLMMALFASFSASFCLPSEDQTPYPRKGFSACRIIIPVGTATPYRSAHSAGCFQAQHFHTPSLPGGHCQPVRPAPRSCRQADCTTISMEVAAHNPILLACSSTNNIKQVMSLNRKHFFILSNIQDICPWCTRACCVFYCYQGTMKGLNVSIFIPRSRNTMVSLN